MNLSTRTILALLAVGLAVSLTACSGSSILAEFGAGQPLPADGVILAPNEPVTLNVADAKRKEYFCSNGRPLHCDRLNLKLYCMCPGIRP